MKFDGIRLEASTEGEAHPMVQISKKQLDKIEYVIEQSLRGNHVLFDPEVVRSSFEAAAGESLIQEDSVNVDRFLEVLLSLETFEQKRAFLESLERGTYERIIRGYFRLIENNLMQNNNGMKH